jgi:hypothetical protein
MYEYESPTLCIFLIGFAMSETSSTETSAPSAPVMEAKDARSMAQDTATSASKTPVAEPLSTTLNTMPAPNTTDEAAMSSTATVKPNEPVTVTPNEAEIMQTREKLENLYQQRERIALQLQAHPKPTVVEAVGLGTIGSGALLYVANRKGNVDGMVDRMITRARDAVAGLKPEDVASKTSDAIKEVVKKFVSGDSVDVVTKNIADIMSSSADAASQTAGLMTTHFGTIKDFSADKAASDLLQFVEQTVKKGGKTVKVDGKEVLDSLNTLNSETLAKAIGVKPEEMTGAFETLKETILERAEAIQNSQKALEELSKQHIGEKIGASNFIDRGARNFSQGFDNLLPNIPKSAKVAGFTLATEAAFIGIKAVLDMAKKLSFVDREATKERRTLEALEQQGTAGVAL